MQNVFNVSAQFFTSNLYEGLASKTSGGAPPRASGSRPPGVLLLSSPHVVDHLACGVDQANYCPECGDTHGPGGQGGQMGRVECGQDAHEVVHGAPLIALEGRWCPSYLLQCCRERGRCTWQRRWLSLSLGETCVGVWRGPSGALACNDNVSYRYIYGT